MKLSVKIEYSCRVLAQMARLHELGEMAHIEGLSQAEEIPSNYLAQILAELRNAGLISSKRGKKGGYSLSRAPKDISLLDIMQAIDGEVLSFTRNSGGFSAPKVEEALQGLKEAFEKAARGKTLDQLVPAESGGMYYI